MVRPKLEIAAVLLAMAVHFVLTRVVGVRGLDILPITGCVLAYVLLRGRDQEVRADWGTRCTGFGACLIATMPLFAIGL